jgi:phenylalanyl-tRNA synthetase beta chain
MRIPVNWLRAHCDPGLATDEIADLLAMRTTDVDRVERVGVGSPEHFVVGRVLSADRHPDADRLTVCSVDDGSGEPRTIVCGAPNVAAGQTVAVARPGAVMPDGQMLGEAELRGVRSSGMILAEDELGIGEDHSETLVLDGDLAPGTPLAEALPIADEVLDLDISPNRPDCLGVYGVAREVHAITGAPLAPDPTSEDVGGADGDEASRHVSLEVDPDICLRFTVRVFEDVKIGPSPPWLRQRLTAAGQRPISNVVDITNYVMLETSQPLHAFDLDRVRGGKIVVHNARAGERLATLDGEERELDEGMALISDAEGPTSLAGIMGGLVSEVQDETTRVAMEVATWVGPNILETSGKLGLRTEASTRFEKQLHPEQTMAAQRLAARLMVELCGARLVPGTADAYPRPVEPHVVDLREERLERLLGERIPDGDVRAILERLGFAVESSGDGTVTATVPPWRDADVRREVDLIEEVARIYGLDKLPVTLPARRRAVGRLTPAQLLRRRVEDALRDRGMSEIVSYSFVSPQALDRLRLQSLPALRLANPLSEEQSVMRPLLLPGLLDAARHNTAHGRRELSLFESARVYAPHGPLAGGNGAGAASGDGTPHDAGGGTDARSPVRQDAMPHGGLDVQSSPRGATPAQERHHLCGLLTQALPDTWSTPARPADFFAAKGLVESLMNAVGADWRVEPEERPFLHPGRAATVTAGDGREAGWIGELHPLVAREWDLEGVAAFELDADLLAEIAPGPAAYEDLTSFPPVIQDIAVVIGEDVPAARVEEAVRAGGAELLHEVRIFDLYHGEQVGEGRKSLALRLEFRAPDRTLTDEEVAERRAAIEAELAGIGGRLRA